MRQPGSLSDPPQNAFVVDLSSTDCTSAIAGADARELFIGSGTPGTIYVDLVGTGTNIPFEIPYNGFRLSYCVKKVYKAGTTVTNIKWMW